MMRRLATILMIAAASVLAGASAHAVPQVLQYQGRLTDTAGEPITDPVSVTFSIFGEEEAETALWTQTFEDLALDNGRFNVLLGGEDAPFTPELMEAIGEGADLWLGIQVGEDDELQPRQQIASVVYSLRATYADTAETVRELAGMPGIAFNSVHRETVDPGASLSVVSVTITTPADGFILLSASGTLVLDNSTGSGALCHANIGEVADAAPEADMGLAIASVDASDTQVNHYISFHSQRVYEKPVGTHVFHLNVGNITGSNLAAANRPSITATFVPNHYGVEEAGASAGTRSRAR